MTAALGVRVSPEAWHQRCDSEAATCLEQGWCAAVRQGSAADPVVLPVLERFAEVVVQDSTTIPLPEVLAEVWSGGGGAPDAGNAALKLNLALNVCTRRLRGPPLHDGRESDRTATLQHDLPSGAVRIVDLGFWDLGVVADRLARGGSSFSRAQATAKVQTGDGQWWDLPALMVRKGRRSRDLLVLVGQEEQVPARLIAVPVPRAVATTRRAELRRAARDSGKPVRQARVALARWSRYMTTIAAELLAPDEALVLGAARWQIEIHQPHCPCTDSAQLRATSLLLLPSPIHLHRRLDEPSTRRTMCRHRHRLPAASSALW